MRWEDLFADLSAQFEAEQGADLAAEVADRTRGELARVGLAERLARTAGQPLKLRLAVVGHLHATARASGADWLLLEQPPATEWLVPLVAVQAVELPPSGTDVEPPPLAGRLGLRQALRGLARDRAPVELVLADGTSLHGTVDRVGADHLDLAVHDLDDPRRPANVKRVSTVSLPALVAVRSGARG